MQFISNVKQIPSELLVYQHAAAHQGQGGTKPLPSSSSGSNGDVDTTPIETDRGKSWYQRFISLNYGINSNNDDDDDISSVEGKMNTKTAIKLSRLHERILDGLQEAVSSEITMANYRNQFRIVNEVSCFDGVFPVDIVIYRNDQIVAMLEIDGPHHYR